MRDAGNAVLMGTNGVGKTTIARNIAHQTALPDHAMPFTTAGEMLNHLAAQAATASSSAGSTARCAPRCC